MSDDIRVGLSRHSSGSLNDVAKEPFQSVPDVRVSDAIMNSEVRRRRSATNDNFLHAMGGDKDDDSVRSASPEDVKVIIDSDTEEEFRPVVNKTPFNMSVVSQEFKD